MLWRDTAPAKLIINKTKTTYDIRNITNKDKFLNQI